MCKGSIDGGSLYSSQRILLYSNFLYLFVVFYPTCQGEKKNFSLQVDFFTPQYIVYVLLGCRSTVEGRPAPQSARVFMETGGGNQCSTTWRWDLSCVKPHWENYGILIHHSIVHVHLTEKQVRATGTNLFIIVLIYIILLQFSQFLDNKKTVKCLCIIKIYILSE